MWSTFGCLQKTLNFRGSAPSPRWTSRGRTRRTSSCRSWTSYFGSSRAEIWHISHESHIMMIHDVKNDSILQVSSQEPSMSSEYDFEDRGVLDTLPLMPESLNLANKSRITYHDDPWCQEWLHLSLALTLSFSHRRPDLAHLCTIFRTC